MSFNKGYEQLPPKRAKKFRTQLAEELEVTDQQIYNLKLGRTKMSDFQTKMVVWLFHQFGIVDIFD